MSSFEQSSILLAEYEQIKSEQRERIGFRDNLLYVTLASLAAVGFAAIQSPGRPALLLLVPPVSFVLGWNYLNADQKVSAIGRYIRTDLAPRLSELAPVSAPVFGWELANQTDPHRLARNAMWLTVDLVVFVLTPLVALAICWAQTGPAVLLLCVSPLEVAAVAALAYQIIGQADLRPLRSRRSCGLEAEVA
jgi:hypothetical protein